MIENSKIKSQKLKLLGLVLLLIVVGCEKKESRILAKVGKTILTESEFYSLIPPQYAGMLTPSQKKELLQKWIDTELIYQEALKEKIHKEREIKLKLREMGREIIANEFLDRYIAKIGSVEESEVREYFNLHKDEYNSERKAAHILVSDKEQADAVVNRLRAGESFSELAAQYSIDPTGKQGGVMGYVRRGDMPQLAEFEDALFSLEKIGDVSEPVQVSYGYYIIKLLDIKKLPEEVKYEAVSEKIKTFLDLTKRRRAFNDFMAELREKKEIIANYELLE